MNEDRAERHTPPRVGRPPALTTEQLVDAAVALVDETGLNALSMPKLAARLDIGTMTIYGYVNDKQHLLDLMAARIFDELQVGDYNDPTLTITRYFEDFRDAALTHPALAQLLADGRITVPAVFETLEAALGPLIAAGWDPTEAVRVFYAALTYTVGFVLWEIPRSHLQPEADYASQWTGLLADLEKDDYPTLTGAAAGSAHDHRIQRTVPVGPHPAHRHIERPSLAKIADLAPETDNRPVAPMTIEPVRFHRKNHSMPRFFAPASAFRSGNRLGIGGESPDVVGFGVSW